MKKVGVIKDECSRCGKPKEANRRKQTYCLACHNWYYRAKRLENSDNEARLKEIKKKLFTMTDEQFEQVKNFINVITKKKNGRQQQTVT